MRSTIIRAVTRLAEGVLFVALGLASVDARAQVNPPVGRHRGVENSPPVSGRP